MTAIYNLILHCNFYFVDKFIKMMDIAITFHQKSCLSYTVCTYTHVGKWRESRFMQIVLSKGLDNILNKAPKFERVAHDRSEAKTAPAPTTRRKKQQVPPKPKTAAKKESPKGDPLMEDFKFETPPTTPPPERVPVVAKSASRDNEFWDFYEKGGTK